jgi:hypothetical protein
MSSSFDPDKDLEQLLMDLVDGELSYVQQQHLAALLRDNLALQKKYQDYLLLDALLHWEQPAAVPLPISDSPRRPWGFLRLAWMLAASVLLALGISLVYRLLPHSERSNLFSMSSGLDTDASEPQASGVAVLRRSVQAQWEPETPRFGVGATLGVGPVHLKSGLVELEFFSGATVVIEGPAHLELLAPDRIRVESGKLRAIVPQPARGFTILSAAAELVDLGTEFGLEVTPNGRTQVHVFQGKVEVYEPNVRHAGDVGQALAAGQGLQVDAEGHRTGIPANGRLFLSWEEIDRRARREADERRRQWRQASEQLRQDPRLIAYYSFQDRPAGGRTLVADNAPQAGLDGAIIGCEWVNGRWPGKRALEFKRPGDRVRLTIPGQYEAMTLMAWVRVEALEQHFNSLFLTDRFKLGAPHWEITQTGRIRLGIRNSPKKHGGFENYDTKAIFRPEELGQWRHLAAVYDAAAGYMAHYVNGQCVTKTALRGDRISLSIGNAEIGNWGIPSVFSSYPIRNLNGRIDEFALFKAALSDKEIEAMYRKGEPNP